MTDIRIERLEELKKATIRNHLAELDLDNILDFYDTLLENTFSGEFDDVFLSENLDDLSQENRKEVLELSRKYKSLCLYNDDWPDSVGGVTSSDPELIAIKLLDSYDFLIKLAKNGGEEVLKFLYKFNSINMSDEGSIIATLRYKFCSDEVLEKILMEMPVFNGDYNDYRDSQKIILCNYPDGLLYKVDESGSVIMTPKEELKKMISMELIGDEDLSFNIRKVDRAEFEEAVINIHARYFGDNYHISK